VLPWRASVDYSTLTYLGLQSIELLVSASTHRSINKSDLIGLQFGVKEFEQIAPANGVDQHRGIFNWPPLGMHAIATATDLQSNHARTKRFEQRLGVSRIVAEICDNESIAIVVAINRCERAGPRTTVQPLREFHELLNSEQPRLEWTVSADDSGRTIATAPHIMRDDERPETGLSIGIMRIEYHWRPPIGLRFWKGFAMGTARS
jgi:hypothetical protein